MNCITVHVDLLRLVDTSTNCALGPSLLIHNLLIISDFVFNQISNRTDCLFLLTVGKIGITLVVHWVEPKDPSNPQDVEACERYLQCALGWFANPVYGNGDYPEVMKRQYAKMAAKFGLKESPLPEFTEKEKALNNGTSKTVTM